MLIHLHIIVTSCYNIKTEWLFEVHTLVVLSSSAWALKIMGMHKNKVVNIWSNILTKCIVIILKCVSSVQFSSVAQSCPTLWSHELQDARPPCPLPSPRIHPDSRPSSQWCHPAIPSSVVPFSSCPQSLPASESFPMSQLFTWGGQSTGVSALASFLPKKSQGWSPSEWTS